MTVEERERYVDAGEETAQDLLDACAEADSLRGRLRKCRNLCQELRSVRGNNAEAAARSEALRQAVAERDEAREVAALADEGLGQGSIVWKFQWQRNDARREAREARAEVERLRAALREALIKQGAMTDDATVRAVNAKLAVALEALRWYADSQNYSEDGAPHTYIKATPEEQASWSAVFGPGTWDTTLYDNGSKARAALAKVGDEGEGKG
jgi:hypothetical protein